LIFLKRKREEKKKTNAVSILIIKTLKGVSIQIKSEPLSETISSVVKAAKRRKIKQRKKNSGIIQK
jgi:hypothetical protein